MYEVSKEIKQEFKNGCTVWYLDNNECYWGADDGWIGTCPYGQDTLFTSDINAVKEWLKFWDEDRNENGNLLDRANEDNDFKKNALLKGVILT